MLETLRRLVPCLIVTCTIIATLGLGSTTVAARTTDPGRIRYRDTGFDPDDRPNVDDYGVRDPDIRSSTRMVSVDQDGRWLLVKFRTYDYLLGYWTVRVYLDVRGGPSKDRRMRLRDTGTGQAGCSFQVRPGGAWLRGEYRDLASLDGAWCRVPLRWVHPTKRIRWTLFSPKSLESGNRIDEYAPDLGWYV
jgi:hypothetical protein